MSQGHCTSVWTSCNLKSNHLMSLFCSSKTKFYTLNLWNYIDDRSFTFCPLSSHEWPAERQFWWLLPVRRQAPPSGKHRLWKVVNGRQHPGRAVSHHPRCLQDLPAAPGRLWGHQRDPGGGSQVVLGRGKDGGECEGGDGAGHDAAGTRPTRCSAADPGEPVHRGTVGGAQHFPSDCISNDQSRSPKAENQLLHTLVCSISTAVPQSAGILFAFDW